MLRVIVFLCLTTSFALGQVLFKNQCNDVTTQQNFDATKYIGVWYEIKRYETFFQLGGECVTAEYGLNPDGSISVNNTYLNKHGDYQSINGEAKPANPGQNDGKLVVGFPGTPQGKYWVLGTDYTSYAVVWSCTQFGPLVNFQFCWVLTRTTTPSAETQIAIGNVLSQNKIYGPKFRPTKQDWYTCKRNP